MTSSPTTRSRPRPGTRRKLAGKVVKLFADAGFGFIRTARGKLAYFERGDVSCDFATLALGSTVTFEFERRGRPRASRVAHRTAGSW